MIAIPEAAMTSTMPPKATATIGATIMASDNSAPEATIADIPTFFASAFAIAIGSDNWDSVITAVRLSTREETISLEVLSAEASNRISLSSSPMTLSKQKSSVPSTAISIISEAIILIFSSKYIPYFNGKARAS
jgi:hypothetical protein